MIITWFYRLEYLNDISIHAFTRCSFFDSSYKSLPLKLWQQADFHKIAEVAQLLSKFVKTVHWRVLIFIYSCSASKNTLESKNYSWKEIFPQKSPSSKNSKFRQKIRFLTKFPPPKNFFMYFMHFYAKKPFFWAIIHLITPFSLGIEKYTRMQLKTSIYR